MAPMSLKPALLAASLAALSAAAHGYDPADRLVEKLTGRDLARRRGGSR